NTTSTARTILELVGADLGNLWDTMNFLLKQGFLSTATGEALDKIGRLLSEPRAGSKRALELSTSNFRIYLDETFASSISDLIRRYFTDRDKEVLFDAGIADSATNPTQITIPEGLTITAENGQASYTASNNLILTNDQLFDYTPLVSNGLGSSFNVGANVLINHNISALTPQLAKVAAAFKCTNSMPIRSGGDSETDDNYRFRLSQKVVSAVKGNEAAIRRAVLTVPGVIDMALIKRTHGGGTFTIIPRTIDPI
ncbi:unnamed protein product, partial [marine sediment metagenome]